MQDWCHAVGGNVNVGGGGVSRDDHHSAFLVIYIHIPLYTATTIESLAFTGSHQLSLNIS